jgi:hypothetical protein
MSGRRSIEDFGSLSPAEKHTSRDAKNTSLRLTREDREAIHEISKQLEAENNPRHRQNDILVDSLWVYLKQVTGKTLVDIQAILPAQRKQVEEKPKLERLHTRRSGRVWFVEVIIPEMMPVFSKTCIYLEHLGFFSSQ